MFEEIQYCYETKKVVSIYDNMDDTDAHLTGYIDAYDKNVVLVAHISTHGLYDGYILKRMSEIYRMDYDGKYERRIEKLYRLKHQSHQKIIKSHKQILSDLLLFAQSNEYIISLEFENSYISGIIEKYDENGISLRLIDDDGGEKGVSIIECDSVSAFFVDTDDEQDMKLLMYK